ncbi:DedA family protein [Lichenifustis flavocetrariae]|uniref:DedA family protein n=1 Tax=Lichenifustis flavocetrariae TaxID=2949735 RepID=A0AA41YUI5_9HYPH|nr:DedA family protein [Lichenifustis flavocetrariae]MCW6507123.1 DedA family protein [Lichenifustis flavocetrariae]
MHFLAPDTLAAFVHSWGLLAVFVIIALESTGIPLPGEATLVSAALVATTTHELSIVAVVAVAAAGAIIGDNLGYLIGRRFGTTLLVRYGAHIGLGPARLRLGRYLFQKHGGKLVFFGRFVAFLRAFAAVLAGATFYPWPQFLIFNAAGGLVWAALYGFGAYELGDTIHRVAAPAGVAILVAAVIVVAFGWLTLKRQEAQLQTEADAAFPTA